MLALLFGRNQGDNATRNPATQQNHPPIPPPNVIDIGNLPDAAQDIITNFVNEVANLVTNTQPGAELLPNGATVDIRPTTSTAPRARQVTLIPNPEKPLVNPVFNYGGTDPTNVPADYPLLPPIALGEPYANQTFHAGQIACPCCKMGIFERRLRLQPQVAIGPRDVTQQKGSNAMKKMYALLNWSKAALTRFSSGPVCEKMPDTCTSCACVLIVDETHGITGPGQRYKDRTHYRRPQPHYILYGPSSARHKEHFRRAMQAFVNHNDWNQLEVHQPIRQVNYDPNRNLYITYEPEIATQLTFEL